MREGAEQEIDRMGQNIDELVDGGERSSAVGSAPHRLERKVALDMDELPDHWQVFLVFLAGALEKDLMSSADLQTFFPRQRQHGGRIRSRRGERLFHIDVCALRKALLRQREMGVRRRDDMDDVRSRLLQHFAAVRECGYVFAK